MKRPLLLPLVPLYAAGQAVENALRPAPRRLNRPVLSVGSLSAGGAGKTPVVQALATLLQQHGFTPTILTRGYGRSSSLVERVDPTGPATRFGDEPLLLAQSGLPVYVAPDRHAAGLLAESDHPTSIHPPLVHILDDGFQHRRLHRDLDLLLLTAEDLHDHLIPAGNLREPLSALRRAHAILLREEEAEALTPYVVRHTKAPIFLIRRTLTLPEPVPARPLAFCALARPESFYKSLTTAGLPPVATLSFPDHHPYTFQDVRKLRFLAEQAQADAFFTTAKDAVKLTPPLRRSLEEIAPLQVIPLTVTFPDEPSLWSLLASHLP